jgi:hypothetical protein
LAEDWWRRILVFIDEKPGFIQDLVARIFATVF